MTAPSRFVRGGVFVWRFTLERMVASAAICTVCR